jgi:hypothetical protein
LIQKFLPSSEINKYLQEIEKDEAEDKKKEKKDQMII